MIENLSKETQDMFQELTTSIKEKSEHEQYDENKFYPHAISGASFHGESWYKCPHCNKSFEFYEAWNHWGVAKSIYRCPRCKTLFVL